MTDKEEMKKAIDPYLDQFFKKRLITSTNTKKTYKYMIYKFFRLIDTDPETYFKRKDLKQSEEELTQIYYDYKEQNVTPYTIKGFFNAVKQFLCSLDKKYKTLEFWETLSIRLRNAEGASEELVPNKKDLKKIFQHADTLQRALFLIQASTGMRIGELCALKIQDVKTDEMPIRIRIMRTFDPKSDDWTKLFTKTNRKRNAFLTEEAAEAYHAWMEERSDWFKVAIKKSGWKQRKSAQDDRVFPMHPENARKKWRLLTKKAGYGQRDSTTGRTLIHPHCLRKFFRSYLGNVDLAEHLMGHAQGMTKHYRNMKLEDLREEFLKYSENVSIITSTNLSEVNESLKQKDEQIKELQKRMNEMKMEILEMRVKKIEGKE